MLFVFLAIAVGLTVGAMEFSAATMISVGSRTGLTLHCSSPFDRCATRP